MDAGQEAGGRSGGGGDEQERTQCTEERRGTWLGRPLRSLRLCERIGELSGDTRPTRLLVSWVEEQGLSPPRRVFPSVDFWLLAKQEDAHSEMGNERRVERVRDGFQAARSVFSGQRSGRPSGRRCSVVSRKTTGMNLATANLAPGGLAGGGPVARQGDDHRSPTPSRSAKGWGTRASPVATLYGPSGALQAGK